MRALVPASLPSVLSQNSELSNALSTIQTGDIVSANDASLSDFPLVDELAVDIFEGRFSGKFLSAARISSINLCNTLYAHYYNIDADFKRVLLPDFTIHDFGAMCVSRAGLESLGVQGYTYRKASENGRIVEQQQILTSQNLIVCITNLALKLDWISLALRVCLPS